MSGSAQYLLDRIMSALGVALIVATGVLFVAQQTQGDDVGAPAAASAAAPADQVAIKDFLYDPQDIIVAAGTKVTFTNQDGAPHTATSGTSPSADGVFDTGTLTKGQSASVTLSQPGTVAFYCVIHPFMKGTVTVR